MGRTAAVIAPHPDDEILGAGGTIARLVAEGWDVVVLVVTTASGAMFPPGIVAAGRAEARRAHDVLGVRRSTFFDQFPAALLDKVPHAVLNEALGEWLADVRPSVVFVPFVGDIHSDHQLVFKSALVALRPSQPSGPNRILAYETLSETNWNAPGVTPAFAPDVFVDIADWLPRKLEAMSMYRSQLKEPPNERSLWAIDSLARVRGATFGCAAAEAFMSVREIQGRGTISW